ncbi:MAG: tRNA lysidine(34) synthetase TilS [Wenzhouxiangella sp.]
MPELDPSPDALPGSGRIVVAFSAGPDSTCLLHQLTQVRLERELVAVHVDHGLDPESGERARQARAMAARFGIECTVVAVEVEARPGIEEAARNARYRALSQFLSPDEVVLTAHHADDQVETVFLRLLRGAGPRGLAGMPHTRRLDHAWLARPMLHWSRRQIDDYLDAHDLGALDDPANRHLTHDRNFLRHRILPALRRRWPGLQRAVLGSARLNREAAEALDQLADLDLDACAVDDWRVKCEAADPLSRFRRGQMIRRWCANRGLEPPPGRRLDSFLSQIEQAARDRLPELRWHDGILRNWHGMLWLAPRPEPPTRWRLAWPEGPTAELPEGLGRLELRGCKRGLDEVDIRAGTPGERIRPAGRHGSRPVAQLMAEAEIPPWQRPMWPRLWRGDELLAVGDRWLTETFADELGRLGAGLRWTGDRIRT